MVDRRLILIANNGSKDKYLPAVTLDVKHYRTYFKTSEGGAWEESEIKFYDNNCTEQDLKNYIRARTNFVKVWQIVFCGHGYANDKGDSVLELSPNNDCEVSKIKGWLNGCCTLLIADSCRKVYHTGREILDSLNEILERRMFSTTGSPEYRAACRRLYESEVYRPNTTYFVEGYACRLNECAHDDDNVGGFYSSALLKQACNEIDAKKGGRMSVLSRNQPIIGNFSSVHDSIIETVNNISLQQYGEAQHPNRNLDASWPFYVIPSE